MTCWATCANSSKLRARSNRLPQGWLRSSVTRYSVGQGSVRPHHGQLRGAGTVETRSGVRFSVFVPRNPLDTVNTDEAILGCVERVSARPGGAVVLVTGDLSMRLRAEAQDINVRLMPEVLRMPLNAGDS